MKLLLKGRGVRIPFPEIPGVKLRIVFFDSDEGRKQPRTNIIILFGYRVDTYTTQTMNWENSNDVEMDNLWLSHTGQQLDS